MSCNCCAPVDTFAAQTSNTKFMKKIILFLAIALIPMFFTIGAQAQVLWSYDIENTSSLPDKGNSLAFVVLMVLVAAIIFVTGLIYKAYKWIKRKDY